MSNKERSELEAEGFEVTELDDEQLEDVAGGALGINRSGCNDSGCNNSSCGTTQK
jgi:hypothetical protein